MNTEITDITREPPTQGWIFYDGDCALCLGLVRRWRERMEHRGFALQPLQAEGVAARLGVAPAELLKETRLLRADGRIFGGADALLELARAFWWAHPLRWLAAIPGVHPLLHRLYRRIAARRHCTNVRCSIRQLNPLTPWKGGAL